MSSEIYVLWVHMACVSKSQHSNALFRKKGLATFIMTFVWVRAVIAGYMYAVIQLCCLYGLYELGT